MVFFKDSPLVRKELGVRVHGYLFDIKTGELEEVKLNSKL
jgi:carbonic anhydrase